MSNTINAPEISPAIRALFDQIEHAPEGTYTQVTEGDFGWRSRVDEWTTPLAETGHTAENMQQQVDSGEQALFCRFWRADGAKVSLSEQTTEFLDAEFWPLPNARYERDAAFRTPGGYLYISDGMWIPTALEDVDGTPTVTYTAKGLLTQRLREADRARQDAVLAAHPEIISNKPSWASATDISDDATGIDVYYVAEFGPVGLTQIDSFEDGAWSAGTACARIGSTYLEDPAEIRAAAAGLIAAANALEAQA